MNNDEEVKETLKQMMQEQEKTREESQRDKYAAIKLLFILFCIVVAICIIVKTFSNSGETSSKSSSKDYKLEAYVMSQDFIKDYLTNPTTTKFPNYSKVNIVQTNSRFKVEAYVESENSFGTIVKTNYYMILERDDNDGGWTKISCEIK